MLSSSAPCVRRASTVHRREGPGRREEGGDKGRAQQAKTARARNGAQEGGRREGCQGSKQ
eukprot:12634-Chlamydomonas_euryale.AAC.2